MPAETTSVAISLPFDDDRIDGVAHSLSARVAVEVVRCPASLTRSEAAAALVSAVRDGRCRLPVQIARRVDLGTTVEGVTP